MKFSTILINKTQELKQGLHNHLKGGIGEVVREVHEGGDICIPSG